MDAFSWVAAVLLGVCVALMVFVAAAESGLITISRARVRLLAGQGVPRAELLQSYVQERSRLLQALGLARDLAVITAVVLGVGLLTGDHGWELMAGVIAGGLAIISVLEALPRALVAHNPERWGLRLAPFMGAFRLLFGGVASILGLPAQAVSRQPSPEEQELLRLMELEENQGTIEEDERKMIRGVFGLEGTTVREIMTPRIDIAALDTESSLEDAIKLIVDRGFSRLPLYEKNADTIAGIIYAKDLFRYLAKGATPPSLSAIARPAFFVPESKRVDELLTEMRKRRVHMAIVVDEYGGTAGLVTIEDLLEEIVGEIEDEHDLGEEPIVQVSTREAVVDGRVSIDDINELFHASIEAEDFDTVGGCVFHLLGRMPVAGDQATTDGLRLTVLSVDGHRVKRVRVQQEERQTGAEDGNGRESGGPGTG